MTKRAEKREYRKRLKRLQLEMKEVCIGYQTRLERGVVVFEGGDAAGKGGAIRRLSRLLDPRGLKVWPICAPTPQEQGKHYLYRFWQRLPDPGQVVIFDRSWYGRVLVERVEGFATDAEWSRAYDEINEFERMLLDDGVRLVKLYLHIDKDVQLARFRSRFRHPLKRWKLSEEDLRNRDRWDDYDVAVNEMFRRTSTEALPWNVIPSNCKRYSRLASIETIIRGLSEGVDLEVPPFSAEFEAMLRETLGIGDEDSE